MNIVVLTGAGISAESGIDTFRGADGLWAGHRVEEVATPEGFAANRSLVQDFYNKRRAQLGEVQPNAAHHALAKLEKAPGINLTLVTQNVDDLHERGGSERVLHMHGELLKKRCEECNAVSEVEGDLSDATQCGFCGEKGTLRPDIVWFGEMPFYLPEIEAAVGGADVFAAIGTSSQVYPAAGFVDAAKHVGAKCVELNLEPTGRSGVFDECRSGKASEMVVDWVEELLG